MSSRINVPSIVKGSQSALLWAAQGIDTLQMSKNLRIDDDFIVLDRTVPGIDVCNELDTGFMLFLSHACPQQGKTAQAA